MLKRMPFLIFIIFPFCLYCQKTFDYPKAIRVDTVDTYFGTKIADPYRGLEDINSQQTQDWVRAETLITDQYEKKKKALENGIYDKLTLYSFAEFRPLIKRGKFYFHFSYSNLETPPKLMIQKGFHGIKSIIVDPQDFKARKNEVVSVKGFEVSADSKYLAVSLSTSGADWNTIRVIEIEGKKLLRDEIENVKFSDLCWKDDGFFYIRCDTVEESSRITARNSNPRVYYHKLGDAANSDKLIFTPPLIAKDEWFSVDVTQDEKYLIIYNYFVNPEKEISRSVLYSSLESFPAINLQPLILQPKDSKINFHVVDNIGTSFLVKTDLNAPTGRVLLYNPAEGPNKFREMVPKYRNILDNVSYSDGKIICLYQLRGQFMTCIYNMDGKIIKQIGFPQGNAVRGFDVSKGDDETFFFVNSFYFPTVAHRLDLQTLKTELVSNTYIEFDQTQFETKYVTYRLADSTEIPMFLTYKKGLKLKNKNPVLMYGYGGFGITLTPFFRPGNIVWIENGGILAVPGIRGGGENGSEWYQEGRGKNKFNSFNDFIFAAKYLIDSNYTTSEKLAIEGGSNGGLLVGVAMTQHPELFKAVVAEMGVFDMLRYNRFTIGANWSLEYGTSSNAGDFANLLGYSPLHNLKKGVKYPATLVITADNDDRVPPLHSYKFLATLQELGDKSNPYLLKVVDQSGHSGSEIISDRMRTEALKCLFLFRNLNIDATTIY